MLPIAVRVICGCELIRFQRFRSLHFAVFLGDRTNDCAYDTKCRPSVCQSVTFCTVAKHRGLWGIDDGTVG